MTSSNESLTTRTIDETTIFSIGAGVVELALFDAQPELPFPTEDADIAFEEELTKVVQDEFQLDTKESR